MSKDKKFAWSDSFYYDTETQMVWGRITQIPNTNAHVADCILSTDKKLYITREAAMEVIEKSVQYWLDHQQDESPTKGE